MERIKTIETALIDPETNTIDLVELDVLMGTAQGPALPPLRLTEAEEEARDNARAEAADQA